MRNHITHISAALAVAAIAVACSGRNDSVGNDRRAQSGGNRGVNQRISLRGCVQPAVVGQGYALRHVIVVPPEQQPQGTAVTDDPVVRGSWVRLEAGKGMTDDLKQYLNNEVTIIGEVIDKGENTIGTAGHEGGTPQEQMPARSSVANGDAPRVAVEKVNKIAENCAGE
jgi:hypothetical protein